MIDVITAAMLHLPSTDTSDRQWAASRPNRGMIGRFQDSNVREVWEHVPAKHRLLWLCIRRHESMSYTGKNPHSSAAGAGQWISSTWRGVAKWVRLGDQYVARDYPTADKAPAWVQDLAFLHVLRHGGLGMWNGTGCAGTDR